LSLETMILFPLALIYVLWLGFHGQNTFINTRTTARAGCWLPPGRSPPFRCCCSRPARANPDGGAGADCNTSPTMQALLGVWVFHEAFTADRRWAS
jgi:chloramphenicol-sensitive protein RarD